MTTHRPPLRQQRPRRVYLQSLNNNANRYNPGTPRSFFLSTDFTF